MKISINKTEYEVPFDPNVITLGEYISYYEKYGKDLEAGLKKIFEKEYEDSDDRITELDNHLDLEAISWFSFWSNLDLSVIKDTPDGFVIINAYKTMRYLLRQEEEIQLPKIYSWRGEEWAIQDFKLNPASEMSFNEVITSKEVTMQLNKLGEGKIKSLVYLSAIFFRKVDEKFIDQMIYEDSERLALMYQLPLSYAMNISFFLRVCVYSWMKTFQSLEQEVA